MAAVHLGTLQGASGSLIAVFVDGAQASQWPGWDGNEDGRNRTMLSQWSETETGIEADVGSAGSASIWQVGDDIVLLDFFPDEDFEDESAAGRRQLAQRVQELPTRGKPKSQGFVQVESGCVAVLLGYADASGVGKALKAGAKKLTSFDDHGVLAGGVGLLDLDHDPKKLDLASKSGREILGSYFAQLPSMKSTLLGTVIVKSGALCVMRTMAYPAKAPERDALAASKRKKGYA